MKSSIVASLLVIALGAAWLLNAQGVLPGVNWVWTGGLGFVGLMVLVLGGVNKLTIVVGPWLMLASIMSVLRQTGRLNVNHEVPVLVITLGVLMLLSNLAPIPGPSGGTRR
jgi:hypothetical protein